MKVLVENSIEIYGMGHPEVKTILNIGDLDKDLVRFKSLETIKNRTLTVWYKYSENNVETQDNIKLVIPDGDEDIIKEFILTSINGVLGKKRKRGGN